ncbi:hypothetical protein ACP70R_047836 [Stipagrostis hirtigluma subsp. patula]
MPSASISFLCTGVARIGRHRGSLQYPAFTLPPEARRRLGAANPHVALPSAGAAAVPVAGSPEASRNNGLFGCLRHPIVRAIADSPSPHGAEAGNHDEPFDENEVDDGEDGMAELDDGEATPTPGEHVPDDEHDDAAHAGEPLDLDAMIDRFLQREPEEMQAIREEDPELFDLVVERIARYIAAGRTRVPQPGHGYGTPMGSDDGEAYRGGGFGGVPASAAAVAGLETRVYHDGSGEDDGEVSECVICVTEYEAGDDVCVMPCRHVFHRECLGEWLSRSCVCPLCRHALPTEKETQSSNEAEDPSHC